MSTEFSPGDTVWSYVLSVWTKHKVKSASKRTVATECGLALSSTKKRPHGRATPTCKVPTPHICRKCFK